jgi:diguanylate cyclase (GGDEF)-like protein
LIVLIGSVDFLSGYELGLSLLYLIPIFIAAWYVGKRAGCALALLSAAVWLLADRLAGKTYSHLLFHYWNAFIRFGFFLVAAMTLAFLKQSLEREILMARVDSLTGAVNSRVFKELLGKEMARVRRFTSKFSLVYMDLDYFKTLNDEQGHGTGDTALRTIAGIIRRSLRETDTLGRMGGDEFAMLLPGLGRNDAQLAVSKIRTRLLAEMEKYGWPVTFSIGVLTVDRIKYSVDEYIKLADGLMYSVKRAGRNSISYYSIDPDKLQQPASIDG